MPTPRLILFDLDNTLLDRNRAFGLYIDGMLRRRLPERSGEARQQMAKILLKLDRGGQTPRESFCSEACRLFPDLFESPGDFFYDIDHIVEYVRPEREKGELLRRLRPGRILALLSNGSPERQRGKLARSGLAPHFDGIFISGEPQVPPKPHPEAFRHILKTFSVSEEEAVMVGDDWVRDIEGARGAGLRALYLKNPHSRPRGELAGEVPELEDLSRLEEYL